MSSFFSKPFRNIIGSNASEAITGVIDQIIPPKLKDLVEVVATIYYGGKLPGDVGSFLASNAKGMTTNAVIASVFGGDPKAAAMMTGIVSSLSALPGDVGAFFGTEAGQSVLGMVLANGGGLEGVGNWLGMLGMGGNAGDMVKQIAQLMALSAFSDAYAKKAINKAEEFEQYEGGMVKSLVDQANKLNDPAYQELTIQKSLDDVSREFDRARESTERNLYARGLGLRSQGPVAGLARDEAVARLEASRDMKMKTPLAAMQATSAALAPVGDYTQRLRATAEEQRMLPFNFVSSAMQANHQSPADQYYAQQLAQLQAQQQQQQQQNLITGLGPLVGGVVNGFQNGWSNMAANATNVAPAPATSTFPAGWAQMAYQVDPNYRANLLSW